MATERLPTFEVDKEGLGRLLERRGKEWVVAELFQNAVDEDVTRVSITIESAAPGYGGTRLVVEDDNPEGFADLRHAYTLFADSAKKDDPTKRGRFNLGEKLVIALADEATLYTTKATIRFADGHREHDEPIRKRGTLFEALVPMNADERKRAIAFTRTLIAPPGVEVTVNGEHLPEREPVTTFDASLRTERSDEHGVLRPTTRKTAVRVYEPLDGEVGYLYELGIPVVATGDKWHVDVGQKVPINLDRDNVPPAFLRDLRALVANNTYHLLARHDGDAPWLTEALGSPEIHDEATQGIVQARFGDKVVLNDPTDREANKIAASAGYEVVSGGALPREAWRAIREAGAILPAGEVTPSPKPHADVETMDPDHYPENIERFVARAKALARALLGHDVKVRIATDPNWRDTCGGTVAAAYGEGVLTVAYGTLGYAWFNDENRVEQNALLIHEYAHDRVSDHLDRAFYRECCRLGAVLAEVMMREGVAA